MKQKIIPILSLFFLTACGKIEKPIDAQKKKDAPVENASMEAWVKEDSAVKIQQDKEYEHTLSSLVISMAKNEYEGGEIILTAKNNISYFDVNVSDLTTDGKDKLESKDVEIFQEYYAHTLRPSNTAYASGYYPDALIPFSYAKAKGINHIEDKKNQGIYLRVHTKRNQKEGIYKGQVTITSNGQNLVVPFQVTVYNFRISDKVHTRSCFLLYPVGLMAGEGDSYLSNIKRQYDFLLDYRITPMNLPSTLAPDSFVEQVRSYFDNPKVTGYNLPYINGCDLSLLSRDLKALVKASVEDSKDYVSKAYVYNLYNDEYSMKNAASQYSAYVFSRNFTSLCQSLVSFFDSNYGKSYLDSVPGLRTSLANVLNLEVTGYVDELEYAGNKITKLSSAHNGICPLYSQFRDEKNRSFLRNEYAKENNRELWWYGCVNPAYPYPTYHIDDSALSPRVISWMQYDYDIDGNLYYQANKSFDFNGTYIPEPLNNYDGNPNHDFSIAPYGVNGDGYLFYPGRDFGSLDPFPSLRLEAIRDGLEEYEYIYELNQKLTSLGKKYNVDGLSARKSLRNIFDSIYSGVFPTTNGKTFQNARDALNDIMDLANLGIVIKEQKETTEDYTITMEFPEGTEIDAASLPAHVTMKKTSSDNHIEALFTIEKTEGVDSRLAFSYTLPNETSNRTYDSLLSKAVYWKFRPEGESDLDYITFSKIGTSEKTLEEIDGEKVLSFHLTNPKETILQEPYVSLNNKFVKANFTNEMTSLTYSLYNQGSSDIVIKIEHLENGTVISDIDAITLETGKWSNITVNCTNPNDYGWVHISLIPQDEKDAENNNTYDAIDAKFALGKVGYSK